jgi:hypothetical protein
MYMENWVINRVQTTARRRVVAWTLALVALLALFGMQDRYFYNFAFGPFEISAEALRAIDSVESFATPFVRVQGEEVIDTGLQQITVRKKRGVERSREVSANYYALAVGGRLLIVKSKYMAKNYEGELAPMPSHLAREMFSDPEMAARRDAFHPFYLDTDGYRVPGYLGLAALSVFLFFYLRAVLPAWRHLRDPSSAPVATRIASWGNLAMLSARLQRELSSSRQKVGGWTFGESCMVRSSWLQFDVLRYEDLVWAYKQVTKQSFYFIPVGKRVAAVLHFVDGQARLQAGERKIDQALASVYERVPWALYGHDDETQKAFDKRRDEIVRGVQRRRQQWQAQVAAQQAAEPATA